MRFQTNDSRGCRPTKGLLDVAHSQLILTQPDGCYGGAVRPSKSEEFVAKQTFKANHRPFLEVTERIAALRERWTLAASSIPQIYMSIERFADFSRVISSCKLDIWRVGPECLCAKTPTKPPDLI